MKTCRYRIYLLSLVSIVALFRLGFTPAPSVTLCVPPPSRREAFTVNVVTLVLLSQAVLLSHFSPALAPSACSCAPCPSPHFSAGALRHATRVASLPEGDFDKVATVVMGRKATDHMFFPRCRTKKQGACDAPYQRAVPCGFGLGGGYTMRLSIKKRMRVLRGKIRCKNGRM